MTCCMPSLSECALVDRTSADELGSLRPRSVSTSILAHGVVTHAARDVDEMAEVSARSSDRADTADAAPRCVVPCPHPALRLTGPAVRVMVGGAPGPLTTLTSRQEQRYFESRALMGGMNMLGFEGYRKADALLGRTFYNGLRSDPALMKQKWNLASRSYSPTRP